MQGCANALYSVQEQTAAGCTGNDTVDQCREKLLSWCVARQAWTAKDGNYYNMPGVKARSKKAAARARELSRRLNQYASQAEKFSNSIASMN